MSSSIIVYSSKYGTCKKYAEKLGKALRLPVISYKDMTGYKYFDFVIFVGGIYAGKVKDIKKLNKLKDNARALIVPVGISVMDEKAVNNINKSIFAKLKSKKTNVHIMPLRGAIDYSMLTFGDALGLRFMYKMLSKKDESTLSSSAKEMLATYGKKADFYDETEFDKIVAYVKLHYRI